MGKGWIFTISVALTNVCSNYCARAFGRDKLGITISAI